MICNFNITLRAFLLTTSLLWSCLISTLISSESLVASAKRIYISSSFCIYVQWNWKSINNWNSSTPSKGRCGNFANFMFDHVFQCYGLVFGVINGMIITLLISFWTYLIWYAKGKKGSKHGTTPDNQIHVRWAFSFLLVDILLEVKIKLIISIYIPYVPTLYHPLKYYAIFIRLMHGCD